MSSTIERREQVGREQKRGADETRQMFAFSRDNIWLRALHESLYPQLRVTTVNWGLEEENLPASLPRLTERDIVLIDAAFLVNVTKLLQQMRVHCDAQMVVATSAPSWEHTRAWITDGGAVDVWLKSYEQKRIRSQAADITITTSVLPR